LRISRITGYRVLLPFTDGPYRMSKGRTAEGFDSVIVEVVTDTGHRLVPVTTGLFDDESGRAEITGAGLAPGVSVEVPAS